MIGRMREHRTLPPIRTGYPINGGRCPFSVVVPIARTNRCFNPSFETNTTSWLDEDETGIGSIATRSTEQQFSGVYSLKVTPTAGNRGVFYPQSGGAATFSTTAGVTEAIGIRFLGTVPNVEYRLGVTTTAAGGATVLASNTFKSTGQWQWIWCIFTETSTTSRRVYIVHTGNGGSIPFYLDCVQIEACETGNFWPTTFIDGDQQGLIVNQFPPAYVWNGTPHASTSSRSGQTRAGGRVVNLNRYGLTLMAVVGLGLVPPQHQGQAYAVLDGSSYDRTRKPDRGFSLVGRFDAPDDMLLRRYRSDLGAVLDRDLVGEQQPLKLLYQTENEWGQPTSEQAEIVALYQGGLEGNHDNDYAQDAVITFTQRLPIIYLSGTGGATLNVQTSVSNANRILLRSPAGVWSAVGTGANSNVIAIAQGLNGIIYIGGDFTSFNGLANTRCIVQYNPATGTISAMGSGAGAGTAVNDIQIAPNGDVWVIGSFLNMGGIGAADYVARWDGTNWNAVGTPDAIPAQTQPLQSTFDTSGNFYYPTGANLTVKRWNGAAWSTTGTAVGSYIRSVVRRPDGNLVVGGLFTSINAVSSTGAIRYNISAAQWVAMTNTPAVSFAALAYGSDGRLYGGLVSQSDTNLAVNNGVDWTKIGQLNDGSITGAIVTLAPARFGGGVYVGGFIPFSGSIALPDSVGLWNGSAFISLDADLPSTATVLAVRVFQDGSMAVGYDASGTATVAGITTVTNSGSGKAYPVLIIKGPSSGSSRVYQFVNSTTNRSIYMNYTIQAGETATLNLDPENSSFVSDFQGNIANTILSGSNEADFFLQPGANTISFFAASSTVTATLQWQPSLAGLDDLVVTP